jgi:hypothetical protein
MWYNKGDFLKIIASTGSRGTELRVWLFTTEHAEHHRTPKN